MRVEKLFISPGHNFFGHSGGPAGTHPTLPVPEIECVPGRGITGDRFFDFKENYKGQITFFSAKVFEEMRIALGLPEGSCPGATRRNVIVSGADLNALIGQQFEIQGVRFDGVEECRPCYWMNHAYRDERAEQWLAGNGGLRARILTHGFLRAG